uniref:ral GTPase-activating protein subunit beta isoform X2 n=1 Tax=Maylandia zebra TaxID=106582 RepID=UPI000D327106|nr:ral GTPase-activating protein subunit beta isoform X2 [Maylandia zebra]
MDQSLSGGRCQVSVLSCFPPSVGRDIAVAVVKPLGAGLGNPGTRSLLCTDKQVKWTMEVLCYGLTLPLEGDTVKLCVDIYTDWLMALVSPRDSTPPPISRDPNLYVQKILRHLFNLFLPRSDQVNLVYLSLYQQVLCAVQVLAKESTMMSRDTWETLLHFLLRINHAMLSPATAAGGVSDMLMAVLLEVWLLSCSRCFPSRSLWQTCRQMLSSWRHQPAVVEQWCRVVAALTSRLLQLTFGPSFPHFKVPEEDAALIPEDMDDKRIPQTWFRFLHLFSNPVELSRTAAVVPSQVSQGEVLRRGDSQLPNIFFKAMSGVGILVNAFLGVTVESKETIEQLLPNTGMTTKLHFRDRLPSFGISVTKSPFRDRLPSYGISRPRSGSAPPTPVNVLSMPSSPSSTSSSPPYNRQVTAANFSKTTTKTPTIPSCHWKSFSQLPSFSSLFCSSLRPSPSPLRCNVDHLLHLFGCWLFDAALISRDSAGQGDVAVMSNGWAAGRAEACGTLCRIFSCRKTAEEILSVYLSRFYLVLVQGLQVSEKASSPVLASILLNSTSLFCCDLRGVNILLPPFISALENVLLDRELLKFKNFVTLVDLRRASILVLLSLLPIPMHFGSVQLEELQDRKLSADAATSTLLLLKPRLISVLIGALQTEADTCNIQLLLAAMLNLIQDSAVLEPAGRTQQETEPLLTGTSKLKQALGASQTSSNRWTRGSNAVAVLWVQSLRLLTQRLTSQWRNDSAVCLSALEVLGGLAKVEVRVEESERMRVVSSVCTYIVFQCSRPPPLHSRDLHSIIVAAFQCLNVWLTQHPTLLGHKECLLEVLEIVELGISGSKSRQEQKVRCKEEKDQNPASLRVKEAAEATLSCVMQVSEAFPFVSGILNEDVLVRSSCQSDSSLEKFRYFVVESSMILAFLEQTLGREQAQYPSLIMVTRGASGRHTWSLELCPKPHEGQADTQEPLIPEQHSMAQEDARIQTVIKQQLLSESFDTVPSVKADHSIPALHETITEEVQQQLEHLRTALKRQQQVEARPQASSRSAVPMTCKPPPPVTHFQAARLFLSHLGLLTPESVKDPGISGVPAPLVVLDSSLPGFFDSLRNLDQQPSRIYDSTFIFYMGAAQRTEAEILKNVESACNVHSHFLDFLSSLGWPVEVGQVGRVSTSRSEFSSVLGDSGGSVFDGKRFILMFTDCLTELTFIVPSLLHSHDGSSKSSEVLFPPAESPLNLPRHSKSNSYPAMMPCNSPECNLMIVWVERFEDIENFPVSGLLSHTRSQTEMSISTIQLIFIHPLKTGLYRIHVSENTTSKFGLVVPLVSGSVVSKRSLGFLVREMMINWCHRRLLESDSTPPPHIRRKHMINDITLRYRSRHSEPAFYSSLFYEP